MVKYDVGSGLTGAATGAAAGAAGGLPGMALGGFLGLLGGGFGRRKDKFKRFEQYTPAQQQTLNRLMQMLGPEGQVGQAYGQGLSGLQQMLDPSSAGYQRFEAPYLQQFEQQTVPGLAERFSGAGAQSGALSSSGFGQALGAAGGQLQTQLAGMKAGLQQQAIRDILRQYSGMLGVGLGAQPFGYIYQPGSPSFGQSALTGWAEQGFPGLSQAGQGLSSWWQNRNVRQPPSAFDFASQPGGVPSNYNPYYG